MKISERLSQYLNSDRDAFSGYNHVMIAIIIFLILLMIPVPPFSDFIQSMVSNPVTGVMAFVIICGGALLPDMDNLKSEGGSAAVWDLGIFGSIISSVMVTISSIITSIFHGKKDVNPETQHRFFWHTLLVPVGIFLLVYFFVPSSSTDVIDLFKNVDISNFPTADLILMLFIATCVYVGAMMLFKKLRKLPFLNSIKASWVSLALMVTAIVICLFNTEANLKLHGYCIAMGYLFHLIGDLFADGGIPALFPITGIFGKFFMRIRLLPRALTVTTGSTIESMLKIIFTCIALVLFYIVFLSKYFGSII